MRLHEILETTDIVLEEAWKSTLARLAAAGLLGTMPMNKVVDIDKAQQDRPVAARQHDIDRPSVLKPEVRAAPEPKPFPTRNPFAVSPEREARADQQKAIDATVTGSSNEVHLRKAATVAGIKGIELAAFLSQCAHESMNFKRLEERGGEKRFARYEPGHESGLAKILGNTEKGDGERFKGRGFIQLTGRWNYTKAAKQTGIDLVNKPELAAEPETAAVLAVWYWKFRVQPRVQDYDDVKSVTKPINSKYSGLKDREKKFKVFKKALA